MRRSRRFILNVATLLSLVVVTACFYFSLGQGQVFYASDRLRPEEPQWIVGIGLGAFYVQHVLPELESPGRGFDQHWNYYVAGRYYFEYGRQRWSTTTVPLRVVGGAAAALPLVRLLLALRRWRRWRRARRAGLCPACGYDLRATPEGGRCPECGAVPTATLVKPAAPQ